MLRINKELRKWTVRFALRNGLFGQTRNLIWQRMSRGIYKLSDGNKTYLIKHRSQTWELLNREEDAKTN